MLTRRFTHCMLRPGDVSPSNDRFKVVGVFNPGVAQVGDEVVVMARVVEQPIEARDGYECSPRYNPDTGELELDWLNEHDLEFYDPRVFHQRSTGFERLRFISYLKVFYSKDGRTIDREGPVIRPAHRYEEFGVEDPRITKIGQTYYITYVAVSHHGVSTALLSTTDFEHFQRHGIIFPPENKDVLLFPERIVGAYAAIHRPVTSIRFRAPEMWIARSPDLIHWGSHEHLLGAEGLYQHSRIGGGTPPIHTPRGWLTLYHGSQREPDDPGPGVYTAGALLLDLQNPTRILARTLDPVMEPTEGFEREGFVNDVVFPTGIVERDDELLIYYGAADENVGVIGVGRDELMSRLTPD